MDKPLTWDLLVHPFFSLCLKDKNIHAPISPQNAKRMLKNARVLNDIWQRRINFLSAQPNRGLIILKPGFNMQILFLEAQNRKSELELVLKGSSLCDAIVSSAVKKLGHPRCIIAPSGIAIEDSLKHVIEKRKLAIGSSTGVAMGEYTDLCVKVAADSFAKLTGQKVRIAAQKGIFSLGGGARSSLSNLGRKHGAVILRAKKIANIRAKK